MIKTEKVERSRIRLVLRKIPTTFLSSTECILKAVKMFGDNVAVSCSFGRDSVVVLHTALQINPNIKVVFNNTGVEYSDTLKYKDYLKLKWNINLFETKPVKSFWWCVRHYGLPVGRKAKGSWGKPMCCWYCKDLPFLNLCKQLDIKANITGIKASDSRARMFTIAQRGQYYFRKTRGALYQFHPLALWTTFDVSDYIVKNNIPLNPLYEKGFTGTGCMTCTAYMDWEHNLSRANPNLYALIKNLWTKEGHGKVSDTDQPCGIDAIRES
jgi:phosphoadenosine phosphosulfate reductase